MIKGGYVCMAGFEGLSLSVWTFLHVGWLHMRFRNLLQSAEALKDRDKR